MANGNNATQAYKTAYPKCKSGHRVSACKLLTKYNIKQEIARLEEQAKTKYIADRQERQRFWTDTMNGEGNMCDKLRASELLGKSQADFIDVHLSKTDDEVKLLSPEQRKAAMAASVAATGPKLSKETA